MNPNKIKLSPEARSNLREARKKLKLAADDLSIKLGKSQAWLAQIERGQVQSIPKDDLINLLYIYTGKDSVKIYEILDTFITTGLISTTEDTTHKKELDEDLEIIRSYFSEYISTSSSADELNFKKIYVHAMLRCMKDFPGATSMLFQNFVLLEDVLDSYKFLDKEQYILKITSLSQKIENILKNELASL